jgi:hypothetical protein
MGGGEPLGRSARPSSRSRSCIVWKLVIWPLCCSEIWTTKRIESHRKLELIHLLPAASPLSPLHGWRRVNLPATAATRSPRCGRNSTSRQTESCTQPLDSRSVVRLVPPVRNNQRGPPCPQRLACCSGPTLMHNRCRMRRDLGIGCVGQRQKLLAA